VGEPIPLFTSTAGVDWSMIREGDGSLRFKASQDHEAVLDRNKAMATTNDGYNKDRTMRRVATIPAIVWLKWKNEGWDAYAPENADKLARKLNDAEWAYLRTAPGQLGVSNGRFR
jgi:hypothetical protein